MSGDIKSPTIILNTGLYPDTATVEAALRSAPLAGAARRVALPPSGAPDREWDAVLDELLKAEKVITL